MFGHNFISDFVGGFDQMLQPHAQFAQAQRSPVDPPAPPSGLGQDLPMQPHPDIPQHQRDRHVQQSQERVARAGPNPGLLQLSVARLNREAAPIRLLDPLLRRRLQAPEAIDQRLPTRPPPLAAPIAALDTHRHRRRPLGRVGERVPCPTAPLLGLEDAGSARPAWVIQFAAAKDHRHQEGDAGRREVADPVHAPEAAIHEHVAGFHAAAGRLVEQPLDHDFEGLPRADVGQGDRAAPALADDVGGGLGREVARAAARLAAINLMGVVQQGVRI